MAARLLRLPCAPVTLKRSANGAEPWADLAVHSIAMSLPPKTRVLLALLAGALALGAAEVSSQEPVQMAPVRVVPQVPGYGMSFKYTKQKGAPAPTWPVREIRFFVERGGDAYRAGLRSGDRLLAINGTPVVGKTWPEFNAVVAAIDRARDVRDPRRYRYTVQRGSETKDIEVILTSGQSS
jgi:hypothetical protein